jgi:hypothetical protein
VREHILFGRRKAATLEVGMDYICVLCKVWLSACRKHCLESCKRRQLIAFCENAVGIIDKEECSQVSVEFWGRKSNEVFDANT